MYAMKRNLYLMLALLFMGTLQVSAQKMFVALHDNTEIMLDEDIMDAKITFSDGKMLFHVNNAVKNTFEIKDIKKIYSVTYSSIETMDIPNKIEYSSVKQKLVVQNAPGAVIAVYHVSGTQVLSCVQRIAAAPISVAHLPAGTYVAVVGSETLKFVKQ